MLNIKIELHNDTYAVIIDDVIYSITTNYEEIEGIVEEFCDENDLELGEDVQVWDTF